MGKKLREQMVHWATHLYGIPGHIDDSKKWWGWLVGARRALVAMPEWIMWVGGVVAAAMAAVVGPGFFRTVRTFRATELAKRYRAQGNEQLARHFEAELSRLNPVPAHPTGLAKGVPPLGWTYWEHAQQLAYAYTFPPTGMTRDEAAKRLVEEFVERHPECFDEDLHLVEQARLLDWILKDHRMPMPYRWRWRNLAKTFDADGGMVPIRPDRGNG